MGVSKLCLPDLSKRLSLVSLLSVSHFYVAVHVYNGVFAIPDAFLIPTDQCAAVIMPLRIIVNNPICPSLSANSVTRRNHPSL